MINELTMAEALADPLIRLVLAADKVSSDEFAAVLAAGARKQHEAALSNSFPSSRSPSLDQLSNSSSPK
ncbi:MULTISPECIES: hypothetical protein [Rhizobium]|uniref:Uncharacterized protein n=1 Tax=Rhizobium altiplani TaxID=1864509 RepID=A0A120FQN6_9HYPH|nr:MULTISPECIES: hypothetical protein [Rhizobium]KWV58834.1 hypothetical protein AS026_29625 [Rhizobium altiplani]